jgi:sterol desaturase/sphingolipid hydroxylase (fatty acid hydroxylase superfamily)
MTQGGLLIFFKYFFNLIDNRIILLWALFYATVHNINYNIVSPQTHRQHHVNDKTNYGIDIWDIIMGTKFDYDTIETHNHASINLLLITALILFFTK